MDARYRTVIYIDGFNFYYGQVKGTPWKWLDRYDCAVIVSNDSDLAEALAMVKNQHKKIIGLVTPGAPKRKSSRELSQHANFVRTIRESALRSSQLPEKIPSTGIHKPSCW